MKPWYNYERIPGVLASSYEKASRMVIDAYYSQVADEIVSNIRQGALLDLGTGPGYLPVEIAKRAPDIHITGVDLSRKLIHMARRNAHKAGLSRQLTFEVGNSGRLRYGDEVFDMVISTGMLHSLKNPVDVFTEIHRVLKKDADAWIYDPANVTQYIDKAKWRASLNLRERCFLWIFGLLGLHKPMAVYRKSDVIPMVKAAGFKKYEVVEREREIRIKLTK
jgi:ubiquinone/menaquinone biosynthesis C-methylase UbiE